MAPTRSIQCTTRPPSTLPSGLVSFGRTTCTMSDMDSATVLSGRGAARRGRRVVKPSDLKRFRKRREGDAAVAGPQDHVLDPCRAEGGIVQAGLDRDPLPRLQHVV